MNNLHAAFTIVFLLAVGTNHPYLHHVLGGVTATELGERKQNLVGTFEVSLSTTRGIAAALLAAIERGYDARWLDEYPQRIKALTLEQVNAAIKQYVDPTRLVVVEAGSVP